MYYIGLDVHKKTISYCVKDAAGCVHQEGRIGSTRRELDAWIRTLPQPRMIAMEPSQGTTSMKGFPVNSSPVLKASRQKAALT
jgi:hypothetical protein